MGDVVMLGGVTRINIPVERVLESAIEKELEGVVVLGYTKDGMEYFASSYTDGGDVLWLLERCKVKLVHEIF